MNANDIINLVPTWVMLLPLYILAFITVAVIGERLFFYHRQKLKKDFFDKLSEFLNKKDLALLNKFCENEKNPVSQTIKDTFFILKREEKNPWIKNFFQDAKSHSIDQKIQAADLETIKETLIDVYKLAGSDQVSLLEKHLSILATIATIAPLLGLLGTVTGMLKSFNFLSSSANVNIMSTQYAQGVAGGITEALVTTFYGLVIAIPAYTFYNYFVSLINSVTRDLEKGLFLILDTYFEVFQK